MNPILAPFVREVSVPTEEVASLDEVALPA